MTGADEIAIQHIVDDPRKNKEVFRVWNREFDALKVHNQSFLRIMEIKSKAIVLVKSIKNIMHHAMLRSDI